MQKRILLWLGWGNVLLLGLVWGGQTAVQGAEENHVYLPTVGLRSKVTGVDFSVALPAIPEGMYTVEIGRWDIPINGTDPLKTTDNLQAAIDWAYAEGYGQIKLPAGEYLVGKYGNDIYQAGIVLHSNMALILDENAVIRIDTNDKWNYCVISIDSDRHVVVRGGTIIGDRDTHIYTPRESDGKTTHDEGHLICIKASQYVLVEDIVLQKATGDGILIVGNSTGSAEDITIRNSEFDTNRRQGISIVGGVRIRIANNEIHHTEGTTPQFGVDLEGAGRYENRDVHIVGNYFHHNRGGDIVNTDGRNIIIDDNVLEQGAGSKYIDGPIVYWKNADQTIRYNSIQMTDGSVNGKSGIIAYSNSRPKTNPATTFIHDNVCHGCGMYMYQSADVDIRWNQLLEGYIVLRDFDNLTLMNNTVTHPNRCWAYRFKNVTGYAEGNTYNGDPFPIPLSSTPWTGCWVN